MPAKEINMSSSILATVDQLTKKSNQSVHQCAANALKAFKSPSSKKIKSKRIKHIHSYFRISASATIKRASYVLKKVNKMPKHQFQSR